MPSSAFARFLRRLNAQGQEKGDGFFASDFTDLSASERDEARALLRAALWRGDDTAPNGLVLLDGPAAVPTLDEAVREVPFLNDARLRAARELWNFTHDTREQGVILEYLRHPDATTRLVALGYLQKMPAAPERGVELARLIEADTSLNNRALAGELLLRWRGIISDLADAYRFHRPFMQAVENADVAVRRSALAQLA